MHTRYSGGDVLLHLQRNKTLGKDAQWIFMLCFQALACCVPFAVGKGAIVKAFGEQFAKWEAIAICANGKRLIIPNSVRRIRRRLSDAGIACLYHWCSTHSQNYTRLISVLVAPGAAWFTLVFARAKIYAPSILQERKWASATLAGCALCKILLPLSIFMVLRLTSFAFQSSWWKLLLVRANVGLAAYHCARLVFLLWLTSCADSAIWKGCTKSSAHTPTLSHYSYKFKLRKRSPTNTFECCYESEYF